MWIAQISDPHVRPHGVLYQNIVDSNAMLGAAVAQINALRPAPDVVVLTGDVVDEGSAEEYATARSILAELKAPLRVIPGNHDERRALRAAFADHAYLQGDGPIHFADDGLGPVRIVAVDVTIPGKHHGRFDESAAAWLEGVLARVPERPTLVLMHQPPFACDVPYLDKYWCEGGGLLAEVIGQFPAVERITCGHVHRHMLLRFGGTTLCTAPSTATAIALQPLPDARPASYLEPPGFLLHHWTQGRGLLTHLVPIGRFPGPYPFA